MSREYVLRPHTSAGDLRIDYAAELNEQQFAAATASPGPSLVLAGAGSGKTRTLTYRVAYLLERGVPADRILLLTFTNKAAREMMRRVNDLLGAETVQLWGGTFHSIGARILRANAEKLGYRPDFTILDRDDSETLIKVCLGLETVKETALLLPKPDALMDLISRSRNEGRPIGDLVMGQGRGGEVDEDRMEALAEVARLYEDRKREANVMDFDDLLVLWLRLMREDEEARERYQGRFQFILVDEYQDTNQIQSDLIDLLGAVHRNVMAVGDDSQSIYSWRGANFRNILEFPRRYPDARIYKVEVNYRSTPEILAVANAAIAANTDQFEKRLRSERPSGVKPVKVPCDSGQAQAAFVGQRIKELHDEGVSLAEMAVLYRSHFHALELQLELSRRGIPFMITSGIRVFEQAHVKDVTAWLKLLANPLDELAFKRLVLMLPGIGPRGAARLWDGYAAGWRAGRGGGAGAAVGTAFMEISSLVPRKGQVAWASVATTLAQLGAEITTLRPDAVIERVLDAFYREYAETAFDNAEARLDELEQLSQFASMFPSLIDFLTQLSLLTELETTGQEARGRDEDRLRLSTVHQAKGLEFQVVFVIMLNEAMFPSGRSMEDARAIEEERRLFYVAVTRARDELYLAYPLMRSTPGQGAMRLTMSRFLEEIPESLIEEWRLVTDYGLGWNSRTAPMDRSSPRSLEEGEAPEHWDDGDAPY